MSITDDATTVGHTRLSFANEAEIDEFAARTVRARRDLGRRADALEQTSATDFII